MRTLSPSCTRLALPLVGLALALSTAGPARALDEKDGEKAALKVCEKKFCDIVQGNDAKKPADFQCGLSKTWAKKKIKDSVDGKTTAWSLGDARCGATLSLSRGLILQAMTAGKHTVEFDPHTVHCEVENEGNVTVIDVTLAPKVEFKDGKAAKAWIRLKKVDGPGTWKATLWTLAKVEDIFGLFQKDVLKAINKLMHETCPSTYGAQAQTQTPTTQTPAPAAAKPHPKPKPVVAPKTAPAGEAKAATPTVPNPSGAPSRDTAPDEASGKPSPAGQPAPPAADQQTNKDAKSEPAAPPAQPAAPSAAVPSPAAPPASPAQPAETAKPN